MFNCAIKSERVWRIQWEWNLVDVKFQKRKNFLRQKEAPEQPLKAFKNLSFVLTRPKIAAKEMKKNLFVYQNDLLICQIALLRRQRL